MPTASRPRRTQEERSTITRAALVDAAIGCLVDYGYAATTTGRVCEQAGLSRGAMNHHFPTRSALIAAALQELGRRRGSEMLAQAEALPAGTARTSKGLDLLWRWYNGPLFQAAVDVAAAARTDAELSAQLAVVEGELDELTVTGCRLMFSADERDTAGDPTIRLVLATIRGLALLPILQPGPERATRQWRQVKPILASMLEPGRHG
jgi:AcrR family transcriptional regulator